MGSFHSLEVNTDCQVKIYAGVDWLDDLTVRASYGTSGNQTVGNLAIMDGWYAS